MALHEIALPGAVGASPARVAPPMEPIVVAEDERARITAILVDHPPVFPSFATASTPTTGRSCSRATPPPAPTSSPSRGAPDVLAHEVFAVIFADTDSFSLAREEEDSWEARQREITCAAPTRR